MDICLSWSSTVMMLFAVYRPPPSTENELTSRLFLQEFSTYLEAVPTVSQYLVMVGDFNVHVDDMEKRETQLLTEMLDTIGLQQHVQGPTHVKGHTLDLLISRKSQNIVLETTVLTGIPSDHHAIISKLDFARPGPSKKTCCLS